MRSWTDNLTNDVELFPEGLGSISMLKLFDLSDRLKIDKYGSVAHEATHHWCFGTCVGWSIAVLEAVHLDRFAARYLARDFSKSLPDADQVVRDLGLLRLTRSVNALLEPLYEGLALFAELDCNSGLQGCPPLRWASRLCGGDPARSDAAIAFHDTDCALQRRATVLSAPLSRSAKNVYLSGYLTVRMMRAQLPNLDDGEFLGFVIATIFDDARLAIALLDSSLPESERFKLFCQRLRDMTNNPIETFNSRKSMCWRDHSFWQRPAIDRYLLNGGDREIADSFNSLHRHQISDGSQIPSMMELHSLLRLGTRKVDLRFTESAGSYRVEAEETELSDPVNLNKNEFGFEYLLQGSPIRTGRLDGTVTLYLETVTDKMILKIHDLEGLLLESFTYCLSEREFYSSSDSGPRQRGARAGLSRVRAAFEELSVDYDGSKGNRASYHIRVSSLTHPADFEIENKLATALTGGGISSELVAQQLATKCPTDQEARAARAELYFGPETTLGEIILRHSKDNNSAVSVAQKKGVAGLLRDGISFEAYCRLDKLAGTNFRDRSAVLNICRRFRIAELRIDQEIRVAEQRSLLWDLARTTDNRFFDIGSTLSHERIFLFVSIVIIGSSVAAGMFLTGMGINNWFAWASVAVLTLVVGFLFSGATIDFPGHRVLHGAVLALVALAILAALRPVA